MPYGYWSTVGHLKRSGSYALDHAMPWHISSYQDAVEPADAVSLGVPDDGPVVGADVAADAARARRPLVAAGALA